jgi:hypothetical protein
VAPQLAKIDVFMRRDRMKMSYLNKFDNGYLNKYKKFKNKKVYRYIFQSVD